MRTIRESTNNRDYNLLLHPWYALTLTYKHQSMDLQEMVMTGLKFICPKLDNACGKWELHPELTKITVCTGMLFVMLKTITSGGILSAFGNIKLGGK